PQPPIGGLRDLERADHFEVIPIVDRCPRLDQAWCAGAIDEAAVEPREEWCAAAERASLRQRIDVCQRTPIGRAEREFQARLHELREVGRELGCRNDQAAERVQVITAQGAVADGSSAARIAVIDQHSEALAEHREWHADLDPVALPVWLPRGAYARLDEDALLTVFP